MEVAHDVARIERGADRRGEDQLLLPAVPGRAGGEALLLLGLRNDLATSARADAGAEAELVTVRLSDVAPAAVRWLWPGRVPLGKVTLLDGDPGVGKSLIALDLAARVTTQSPMPDRTLSDLDAPQGVVLLACEDDAADTIRPRLDAAGADCSRVVLLKAVRTNARARRRSERACAPADSR